VAPSRDAHRAEPARGRVDANVDELHGRMSDGRIYDPIPHTWLRTSRWRLLGDMWLRHVRRHEIETRRPGAPDRLPGDLSEQRSSNTEVAHRKVRLGAAGTSHQRSMHAVEHLASR